MTGGESPNETKSVDVESSTSVNKVTAVGNGLCEVEWDVKRLKTKSTTSSDVSSTNNGGSGGQKLRLRAQLGLLPSDAKVDVEVGDTSVRLSVSSVYKSVEMQFPGKIDRASAVAKLRRNKGVLEVHATLIA
jgi:hypothetical protein